jgi:hypothetical protein
MKSCIICSLQKPFEDFYKNPKLRDGHTSECKSCIKEKTKTNHAARMSDPLEKIKFRALGRKRVAAFKARKVQAGMWNPKPRIRPAHRAHSIHEKVHRAVASGKLVKQPCEVCGNPNSAAHHEDYSKPLDVKWLCQKHHMERHVQIREEELLRKAAFQ